MKVSKTIYSIASVLLFLALLVVSKNALAQGPDPQSPDPAGYVILPPMPDLSTLPLERRFSRQEALLVAEKIKNQQTRDLQASRKGAQPAGSLAGSALAADLSRAADLPDGATLVPEKQAEACQARYVEALSQQIWALSRQDVSIQEASAADPSIVVYAPEGSEWTYISGRTGGYLEVQFQILREGVEIASGATTSDMQGYYFIVPEWNGCEGYNWQIQPGDVVIVRAHGATTSMVVAKLSAWADGSRNVVEGQTDPGREIRISLYVTDPQMACYTNRVQKTVQADAAGKFMADFVHQADFNGSDFVDIQIVDSNGSITLGELEVMHLYTTPSSAGVGGVVKPKTTVNIRLARGGVEIERQQAASDLDGWFFAVFMAVDSLQKGDLITVQGGGITLSYAYIPVSITADGIQHQVIGKTDPGRAFIGFVQPADATGYGPVVTTCEAAVDCAAGASDASGNFTASWGNFYTPLPGDSVHLQVFDNAGNYTYISRGFPVINTDLSFQTITGYWTEPVDVLTVTLKSDAGEVLEQGNPWVAAWDGQFDYYSSQALTPGQTIEVSDGTGVRQMVVSDLGSMFSNQSGYLSGAAAPGKVIGIVTDFKGSTPLGTTCQEQASAGAYSLDYSEVTIGGWDRAHVFNAGVDGNYTSRRAYPFYVDITPEFGEVFVTTLQPYESVVIQLWRNEVKIEEINDQSSADNFLYAGFSTDFLPGDILKVDSVLDMETMIPEMSVGFDTAKNLVSGKTVPNTDLDISILKPFFLVKGDVYSRIIASFPALSQPNGEFVLDLTGRYDYGCSPFVAGTPCQYPNLTVFLFGDHTLQKSGPVGAPVQADTFEAGAGDNSRETAVLYSGKSQHSFHVGEDEDWVKIQIPAGQVGKKVYLATTEIGPLVDTILELYDGDGATLLDRNDDGAADYRSLIEWTPVKAGTYYVRILPAGPYAAGNCGAFYSFELLRSRLSLPVIQR